MTISIIIILTILFIQLTTIVIHLVIIDEKCNIMMKELGAERKSLFKRIKEKIK